MRTTLNWIASILVGVCAAPLAALIVGTAADFWEKWLRVSTQEGAPGYWVVMFSSIAALGALIAGVAIARGWLLSAPHFLSALGTTVALTLAATLAATGLVWITSDVPTAGADGERRYRTQEVLPPPPPKQEEAQADALKEAGFRALAPDAPLANWLEFTRYGTSQARIDSAIAAIRARPNYIAEMAHEMLDGDYDSSRDALRAVAHIHPPPAELAAGIAEVGEEVARTLRALENETPGTAHYEGAVTDISTRFSAWMEATRPLQESQTADFVPQLRAIIEPARRLDQANTIRLDVVRVASFYLDKWAGIAPLPTDPPPR